MRQANVDELRRMGRIIYLDVKPEEVVRRLAGDTTRPLLQGENVWNSEDRYMRLPLIL